MTMHDVLERLGRRYGITSEYSDIWGQRHSTSTQTQRALLAAMGVPTATDDALVAALDALETSDLQRLLPAVRVVRDDESSFPINIGVPGKNAHHRFHWRLFYEDGAEEDGDFSPADLRLLSEDTCGDTQWQRYELTLSGVTRTGYHRLEVYDTELPETSPAQMSLIVAPGACYQPEAVRNDGRVWGIAAQLYAVRSARNWGIGDYTDLRRLLAVAAQAGADLVGLNPLHALFPHNPAHNSPYSPSSRLFLNILYLDIEAIADFVECEKARVHTAQEDFQARLRALRASEHVDYVEVSRIKIEVLQMLYRSFRQMHLEQETERAGDFRRFREQQGSALREHALYEALQAHFHADDASIWGWPVWPEAWRSPIGEPVDTFASEHETEVMFYEYCQWQADVQLQSAAEDSHSAGMGVGIYQDLAVSVDVAGAEAWIHQDLYASEARIGSPADDFNLNGQDWGLPPWRPEALREQGYAPFIATLRQNMRHAGALRIDHVMALMRLFWIPLGEPATTGAYVNYPFSDMLGIVALESQRNQCLVIGEDLGTVPDEVREALGPLGVLSYRLLYFEKGHQGCFKAPEEFEQQALVAVTTHDLPTLAGFWQGYDLELRERLGLFPTPELRERQIIGRAEDRARLLMALERESLLPAGMTVQPVATPAMTPELACAVHRYLARTPSRVMMIQAEDMLGEVAQVNMPGTTDEHPNWSRKLLLDCELWEQDPHIRALFSILRGERGAPMAPTSLSTSVEATTRTAIIPRSTYRLQLHSGFTFRDAALIVPYLQQLGISHCYSSPCLQARPGSPHGYDIINHNRLNPELGGEQGFDHLSDVLKAHDMSLIMDMAPNHMGIMGSDNSWWLDVLENGVASNYATFFDIDWTPLKDSLRGKVLLPVLGDHYGTTLELGELTLALDAQRGELSIHYYEHRFPLDPQQYPQLLDHDIARLEERLGTDDTRLLALQSLVTALAKLPAHTTALESERTERARDKEVHKANLARLYEDADIACFIDENLDEFNSPTGIELMDKLLDSQAWRLAYWRVASDEINYRRFFDINDLAGVRMEVPEVFEATHALVLDLVAAGKVQGLRIDHPDGLYDPAAYFKHVQARVRAPTQVMVGDSPVTSAPGSPIPDEAKPLYMLVEKILARHERLHQDWAVYGTTGYEFSNLVDNLFVDSEGETRIDAIYQEFTGEKTAPNDLVYDCKKLIIRTALASELNVLAQQLGRIAELERHTRDFTLSSLREALADIVAWFPVYRTYVTGAGAMQEDRHYLNWAVNIAKKKSPAADTLVFDFVREVLLTDIAEGKSEDYRQRVVAFAMKFQQYTGPVMAKGLEDTAFYRYNRLLSLNEVGSEPDRFGLSVAAFHFQSQQRLENWPHAMLSTSTHDSKRSEDVRSRINVLSEITSQWAAKVRRWARLNAGKKRSLENTEAPSRNDEYLLYQTLVGAWPVQPMDEQALSGFRERIQAYMNKAIKEAKVHTSWINPDSDYEDAVAGFIDALLEPAGSNTFSKSFLPFQQQVSRVAMFAGLSRTLLKLTAPGVPDFYQGNELWEFRLVDPDNRQPIDYERRATLLAELQDQASAAESLAGFTRELVQQIDDGRAKLYLVWRGLQARLASPEVFHSGSYQPLGTFGERADNLCVFARNHGQTWLLVVVPRLLFGLAAECDPLGDDVWGDTRLEVPVADWLDLLTDETHQGTRVDDGWCLPVGRVLGHFPVALLLSDTPH
ncbi:malto-oligosyltrehalose synthase [Kineobactrum sediminis]|uniref:4-alpha-glucanotransferase n=1 Tax=Kineobactrum sediminis TaxID=1905677 RepID=A0A2N5Y2G2_9GAMM|nr:malto-oligosyltrehalose synthase [Kineobactrum sediminis]PLW82583.1 malto-oligosyltrehalose synthase [Kineobactrum sediminis]